MKAKDIMTKEVITLNVNDTVEVALQTMNRNNVNGAPVVDENRNLIGMLVKADIYRFLIERGHYETCPVEWVMTRRVITAEKEEDIIDIAKRLREKSIISIPIIEAEKIVGIISLENLIDYYIGLK